MSADLWMGIAIGSVAPWVVMIAILRTKHEASAEQLARANAPTELLRVRNDIGMQQVEALEAIAGRMEDMELPMRDRFAGEALHAIIRNMGPHTHDSKAEIDACRQAVANRSYAFADAMMFQRNNVPAAIVDEKLDAVLAERNALKDALENYLTRESESDLNQAANTKYLGELIAVDAKHQLQLRAALGMVAGRAE